MLDGGRPWETIRTERTIYRVQNGDAGTKSKNFRTLSMVPALALPPKWLGRKWLGAQSCYKGTRAKTVPMPGFAMVAERR